LHFFLQIIKFEEIRKNCSYIIAYNDLYISNFYMNYMYMSNFFLISSNLIICKRNNAKIIFLIIFLNHYYFSCIKHPYMPTTVSIVSS